MSEFLSMGGYAGYVWTAYGITLVVIVLNICSARRRHAQGLEIVRQMVGSESNERRPTVRENR
jgi:heme exporter protein D